MIGSLPRFLPLETIPLRYAMSSAGRSATRASRGAIRIGVDAADLLVQRHELLGRDRPGPQCLQPVLNADVVDRLQRALAAGLTPAVVPQTAAARSGSPQRVPFGFVTGS